MEVSNLTEDSLYKGNDGEVWLKMVRRKTNKEFKVPLLPMALRFIEKYRNHPLSVKRRKLLPVPSNQRFNGYIQEVGIFVVSKKNRTITWQEKVFPYR